MGNISYKRTWYKPLAIGNDLYVSLGAIEDAGAGEPITESYFMILLFFLLNLMLNKSLFLELHIIKT